MRFFLIVYTDISIKWKTDDVERSSNVSIKIWIFPFAGATRKFQRLTRSTLMLNSVPHSYSEACLFRSENHFLDVTFTFSLHSRTLDSSYVQHSIDKTHQLLSIDGASTSFQMQMEPQHLGRRKRQSVSKLDLMMRYCNMELLPVWLHENFNLIHNQFTNIFIDFSIDAFRPVGNMLIHNENCRN